ncbi:Calx-beta domain-containing protein [Phenylobacterium sp.]|jgi:beta-glucanase (GH16 family)|uniref:Calx-beta domain-containing protein n=1 Tax=Phenylobacterium sp. TaxID=1871053 RepID=UPI002F957077
MTYINARGQPMPETETEQGRVSGTSAGNETINAPNAPGSSLSGEGGGDLLIGNSYGNRFWITDTRDRVQEQANGGIDTMIGWTSLRAAPNIENLQVNGAFNYAYGNELGNLIVVDDQSHWIYGAGGDDVMVGAKTAKTTFVVKAGEGSDVIYNWQGNDQLQLWGYGFNSAADIRGAMTQVGGDVVLKLSTTETLTFRGTTLGSFVDRQFLLPLDTTKLGAITFEDNFNALSVWDPNTGTGLWKTNYGGNLKDEWAYTLTSNGERQVYVQPDYYGQGEQAVGYQPLTISNGVLSITAKRIPDAEREGSWGREYYSGMVNTLGTFEQQYGYFEMKAQLPTAHGTWPAFWLMPTPYVAQVEADIMEGLAATPYVDYRRAWGGGDNIYDNALKIDPTGFHTYGMLWTPQTVTFYYDGIAVLQAPTPANWTEPMGLIVNMAVGGWGGEPNSLQFPDSMKVDYVRVYNLADNSAVIQRGQPELPVATLKPDGGQTSGTPQQSLFFDQDGQALSSAKIAVYGAKPATLPPEKTFVIYEQGGAVFGAVSNGGVLGPATPLMAGSSSVFTGSGTWLTDGRVVVGYMNPAITGQSAWAMIFDPSKGTFTKHQLGNSTGDIDFVAMPRGNFAASWDATDGTTHARVYDGWAYGGKGWYGPERQLTGDLTGLAQNGDLIAQSGSGQQLYSVNNPPPGVSAIVSIGPMAGVAKPEGNSGSTAFTFTITRDFDLSQKTTVAWSVRGQGAAPADALDFVGGAFPSGVATFEPNQASATITVLVQGDTYVEGTEEFLVTLLNPVGAKLGQATATGFIQADGDNGGAPPPPPTGGTTTLGFSTGTVTLNEGNSGSTAFTFTVTRSGPTTGSSTVNWAVSGSGTNAAAAGDFTGGTLPFGSLTFAAGETSKTITVNVAGDTTVEQTEGFTVTLSGASGAVLGTATAAGVITNDDQTTTPPPSGSGQVYNSPGPGSTVVAGSGDDTINASQGSDVLTGGAGADKFAWAKEPWSPARVTDFAVGTDKLDLSALFQAAGYTGTDPVADKYIWLISDDAGGTKVLFDRDGAATGQQWPSYIIQLQGVSPSTSWAQLAGSGGTTPPPPPPTSPQVSLTTTTLSLAEGNSGLTAFSYTVTRTGSTTGTSTVNWAVTGSGTNPAAAADFAGNALPAGTLTFAAGETSKTIVVNVAGDTSVEQNEGFTLMLSGASGATLGTASATGVITNDDSTTTPPPSGSGQVYNSPGPGSTVVAGSGDDTINASQGSDVLTGGAGADKFAWAKEPWSPARVTDFAVGTDKLDLSALFQAAGYTGTDPVADKYIWLISDDAGGTKVLFDRDGAATGQQWPSYIIQLQGVSPSTSWAQLAGSGGTTPPPPPPPSSPVLSFSATSVTLAEGNTGLTAFTYTVTRTGSTSGTASVDWSVSASGANPASGADFQNGTLPLGKLNFADGEGSKTFTVYVTGDTAVEANETFTVRLTGPTGATLGTATATGTITNDDSATTPPPGGTPGQTITSPGPGSTLVGTANNDTLISSQGSDVLTGGGGADYFVFGKENWSPAKITDFVHGTDKIDLRALFDAVGYTGTDPFAAGYMRLIDDGAGGTKVLFDRDAGGPNPEWPNYVFQIEHVAPSGLTLSDWIIQ